MLRLITLSFFLVFSKYGVADTNLDIPLTESSAIKLEQIPTQSHDIKTQNLLTNIIKRSGWFPELKVSVNQGLVEFEGSVKNEKQIDWLIKMADRLPSVVGVINKSEVETPPLMAFSPVTDELVNWVQRAKKNLPVILVSMILLVVFYFSSSALFKISQKFWSSHIQNIFLVATVTKLTMVPIFVFMFYMILLTLGLEGLAVTIIGGTGVMGLVLGLAFKGIAENFFSGILLAIRSPFEKGDMIKVGDNITGVVQNLNMRGTTLMDLDGTMILIPNTTVVQSIVQNVSTNPLTRTYFDIGIGFDDSITQAQEILIKVLSAIDKVEKDPSPTALVELLGVSSVTIRVYFWLNIKTVNLIAIRSRVIAACKAALMSSGISMPDDNREIIFKAPLQVSMLEANSILPVVDVKKSESLNEDLQVANKHVTSADQSPQEIANRMGQGVELPGNSSGADLLSAQRH